MQTLPALPDECNGTFLEIRLSFIIYSFHNPYKYTGILYLSANRSIPSLIAGLGGKNQLGSAGDAPVTGKTTSKAQPQNA